MSFLSPIKSRSFVSQSNPITIQITDITPYSKVDTPILHSPTEFQPLLFEMVSYVENIVIPVPRLLEIPTFTNSFLARRDELFSISTTFNQSLTRVQTSVPSFKNFSISVELIFEHIDKLEGFLGSVKKSLSQFDHAITKIERTYSKRTFDIQSSSFGGLKFWGGEKTKKNYQTARSKVDFITKEIGPPSQANISIISAEKSLAILRIPTLDSLFNTDTTKEQGSS